MTFVPGSPPVVVSEAEEEPEDTEAGVNNLHFAGNEKTGRKSSENEKPGSF